MVFQPPAFFDYGATFLWAVSGAMIGGRRGYDVVGMFFLALVSATGGGLIRDGLFLQQGPPALVRSPDYLGIVLAATVLVWLFGSLLSRITAFPQVVGFVDAIGLGAYAVVGMTKSLAVGISPLGAILVGAINAVGGGMLRDIILNQEPTVLKPGTLYVTAAVIGCIFYLVLIHFCCVEEILATWSTVAVVFIIRMLALRYDLKTTAYGGFLVEPPPE